MRCATFCICFWIAGLVGAEAGTGSAYSLVTRHIHIRGLGDRKRGPQKSKGSRSSSPHEPPAQRHSPDRDLSRWQTAPQRETSPQPTLNRSPSRWTISPSISSDSLHQQNPRIGDSPRVGANGSRSPTLQRDAPDASSPRGPPGFGGLVNTPPGLASAPAPAPARIRTNPTHLRQSSSEGAPGQGPSQPRLNRPGSAPSQGPARSRQRNSGGRQSQAPTQSQRVPEANMASDPVYQVALREMVRTQRQRLIDDHALAKASGSVQEGRGSVMTSRLGDHGPSQLTADHSVGTFSRVVASPYHASVLATNNLNTGSMSARASGNLLVKGRIDSLDPNGRGVLRTAVPGKAEIKTELRGVGTIASEGVNYNPSVGHARIQADFHGYGFVEAAATQDTLRPELAVGQARWAGISNRARSRAMQEHQTAAPEEAMPQAPGADDLDAAGPSRQSKSSGKKSKSSRKG